MAELCIGARHDGSPHPHALGPGLLAKLLSGTGRCVPHSKAKLLAISLGHVANVYSCYVEHA